MSAQPIDHEDICKVGRELTKEYSLTPKFSIVIARCAKEPTIHVMTIIGYERMMPKLPTTYKGCIIEQSKSDRPVMSPAYR